LKAHKVDGSESVVHAHAVADTIIDAVAGSVYRTLLPRFARYESLARLSNPNPRFRGEIAVAISKYFVLAIGASQLKRRPRRRRMLANRTKTARKDFLDLDKALSRSGVDPKHATALREDAFRKWWLTQHRLNQFGTAKCSTRGRPTQEADNAFVRDIGAIYERAAGRGWTISENQARADRQDVSPYTGAFSDLIKTVHADALRIFRQTKRDMVDPLSTNILRKAKQLRGNSKPKNTA
jgi:hypothetical protein